MARNRTGNYPISGKACDVEYRAKRLEVLTEKARMALESIDPNAVAEGSIARGIELVTELAEITKQILGTKPAKRAYKAEKAEKPAKAPKAPKEKPARATKSSKKEKTHAQQIETLDSALTTLDAELNDDLDVAAE